MFHTLIRTAALGPRTGCNARTFFTSSVANARQEPSKQLDKLKQRLKAEQANKKKSKEDPKTHPLYLDVPVAMRYLRAAEVGQPTQKTTVLLQLFLIPLRGSKPIEGSVRFPKPLKNNLVMVFSTDEAVLAEARELGVTEAGGADLIQGIADGSVKLSEITHAFATPEIVKDLKSIAKAIGPKGLMPAARKGTVSEDVASLIRESVGALPFKQKGNNLSLPIGRCDFSDKEILENLKAASDSIHAAQPADTKKPNLILKAVLLSTIGPSFVVNIKQS